MRCIIVVRIGVVLAAYSGWFGDCLFMFGCYIGVIVRWFMCFGFAGGL